MRPIVALSAAALIAVPVLAAVALAEPHPAAKSAAKATSGPVRVSLQEARRQVRMMNDIYITAVLATHKMYVQDPGTPSAIAWAKQVIAPVTAKGWPEARVFTTTDRPLNPENQPVDAFEKAAVEAFHKGQPSFERVEGSTLRYATEVRLVDKSCLICHVRNKPGDLVGGVSYKAFLAAASGK